MDATDLLSLTVGAIVIDTIVIAMNYGRFVFVSDELTKWYTTYRLSAMLMDVLVVILYITVGMRVARANKASGSTTLTDLASIVAVQVCGDLLFYKFFSRVPSGTRVFDTFKDYAAEVGAHALWSDATMVVGTYFVARSVHEQSMDAKRLACLVAAYVSQYVLYLK